MRLQQYNITSKLQPYVKLICTMDNPYGEDTSHIRVLPDACGELFINYTPAPLAIIGNDVYKSSMVTFRMSRPMDVQMRKGQGCIAICFQPGMAYKFIHLPMYEFTDTITPLADIWKDLSSEIEDKLANAQDNATRVAIVQQYLIELLTNSQENQDVAYCLQLAQLSSEPLTVKDLTTHIGITQRHLSRKFRDYVGLSPKEYLRVNRFIRSLQHLKKYPERSLTNVAYESGYYDQAHFIHDYNTYTGHTPGEVARSRHILF